MDIYQKIKIGKKSYRISFLSIITVLYFCKPSFVNFATAIGFNTRIMTFCVLLPFVVLFSCLFIKNLKNVKWDGIILYILCAILFLLTIKFHPEYSNRFNDIYNNGRFSAQSVFMLGSGIYTYYIIRMFDTDLDKIYNTFKIIPYIIFFFNLSTLLNRSSEYAMGFGYQMGIAAILFLAQYLYEEKKIYRLIFSLAAIFLGIIYGARATILGYVVFIILYIIWKREITIKKLVLICGGIIGIVLYSSRKIMLFLYNSVASIGLESRTLYLIASGDVLSADKARQERIWPVLNNVLKNSSFFKMYGAYGDRYFLNPHYPYAHSIIYEMLITFGKCLGGLILIYIVVKFILTFVQNKRTGGLMTLVFGSFSLCRLMVSSSFWIEPFFWAFLAVMVNCRIYYKQYGKKEKRGMLK